jgi:COP9 signalosome complex subunit 4
MSAMDSRLDQLSTLPQKDKSAAYISLLNETFASPRDPSLSRNVHALVEHLITHDPGIIVGRQVLSELVQKLTDGTIGDTDVRKEIVQDVFATVQPRLTTYEEQVSRYHNLQFFSWSFQPAILLALGQPAQI